MASARSAAFGARATLGVMDARRCDALGSFDAIVTDLPLGRNSRVAEGRAEEFFPAFFAAAARAAPVLVLGCDASAPLSAWLGQWRVTASFDWRLHKGLVKRVSLLER